jgi:hypothetical protein
VGGYATTRLDRDPAQAQLMAGSDGRFPAAEQGSGDPDRTSRRRGVLGNGDRLHLQRKTSEEHGRNDRQNYGKATHHDPPFVPMTANLAIAHVRHKTPGAKMERRWGRESS